MAEGASPGESMVPSVGTFFPKSPSLPAAATTNIPERTAFSTAVASGSHGVEPVSPQAAPTSSGPPKAELPSESTAICMPSLRASLMALMTTSPVVKSFTPGEPNTL